MITVGRQSGFCYLGAAALAFGLTACGAESPGGGSEEAVGSQGQGLVGQFCDGSNIQDFSTTGGFLYGPSVSTHFCSLTRINGRDGAERAYAYVDQWSGSWVMSGYGTMSCVPRLCFSHPSPSAITLTQPTFYVSSSGSACTSRVDMTWSDSASALQGIRNYRAENGFADTLWNNTRLSAIDECDPDGYMEAYGTSFFVGNNSGDHVEVSPVQIVGNGISPSAKNLIPVTDGFCYFRNLGYQLAGSTKNSRITHSGAYWVLTGSGSPLPQASAECLYYHQSP